MKPHWAWWAALRTENPPIAKTTLPAQAMKGIASVETEINRIEGQALADVQRRSLDPSQKIIGSAREFEKPPIGGDLSVLPFLGLVALVFRP